MSKTIEASSKDIIEEFIELLTREYEFEKEALLNIWINKYPHGHPSDSNTAYGHLKKIDLQKLCKEAGYSTVGTKNVLIDRLEGRETKEVKGNTKKGKGKKRTSKILQKLLTNSNIIHIQRNQFHNYEHAETGLVFDAATQKAIGRQAEDGSIQTLSEADIDLCREYKFEYIIPHTINEL